MQPATIATLGQLETPIWFSRAGIQDTQGAFVLSSWVEAMEHAKSKEWQVIRLDAANQLRERLLERSIERFRRWNAVVDEIKNVSLPFVKRKIEKTVAENNLPEGFEQAVQWDILHLCMECEYSDIYPTGFYTGTAYWYMKGHFPCGWTITSPKGRPIIY